MRSITSRLRDYSLTLAAGLVTFAGTAQADFVINDDLIVDGSACIGFDCVNGESFSFDTIRLKENNLRIKFDDTSVAASFPRNDWQLTANDSANGGASKFSIEDVSGGRTPFTVTAGARSHALFVDSQGDVGIGTSTPAVELHAVSGDTPTLRLEQNGSSGFAPQTWDVAGNETSFFIRDATNGSTLPFRIRPGAASQSLVIDTDDDVGIGILSPDASLHVFGTGGDTQLHVEEASGTTANNRILALLENNGAAQFALVNTNLADSDWRFQNFDDEFRVTKAGTGNVEMALDASGNLTITGGLVTTGGGGACTVGDPCDAVFDPAVYTVPSIEEHAALMWEKKHLPAVGPTGPDMPINMTVKMLRMLNELEHAHIYIEQLHERLEVLEEKVAEQG